MIIIEYDFKVIDIHCGNSNGSGISFNEIQTSGAGNTFGEGYGNGNGDGYDNGILNGVI